MIDTSDAFTLKGTSLRLNRMGYGAMRLSGPGVWGPPQDEKEAIAVLRTAVDSGVNHIDTSDFYGPHATNQLIRKALSPYPKDLTIVTKVGYKRTQTKDWVSALSEEELVGAVYDNLKNLGLEVLPVVNLRLSHDGGPDSAAQARALRVLVRLKQEGLIQNIGVSNVTPAQYAEAKKITAIVCVQNEYNVINRADDAFIEELGRQGVAYVPFFPLGGFQPIQSKALSEVAKELGATRMQVAIAWLLGRGKNVLVIPGTSSVSHLRENLDAQKLVIPEEALSKLDSLSA